MPITQILLLTFVSALLRYKFYHRNIHQFLVYSFSKFGCVTVTTVLFQKTNSLKKCSFVFFYSQAPPPLPLSLSLRQLQLLSLAVLCHLPEISYKWDCIIYVFCVWLLLFNSIVKKGFTVDVFETFLWCYFQQLFSFLQVFFFFLIFLL